MPTAILVDGGFFIKRYRSIFGSHIQRGAEGVAKDLYALCMRHMTSRSKNQRHDLYRIFFYDCPPLLKKIHNPISQRVINFGSSNESLFRNDLHKELHKMRKVAVRLGHLSSTGDWQIRSSVSKKLFKKEIAMSDVKDSDVMYNIHQKGVDMRIGIDIASLAFKKLANRIILIAGDSDFVPAAKLSRREGIDFILDPMWNPINPMLHEHIDGLHSTCPKPSANHHALPA